jgi:hypothetical protein
VLLPDSLADWVCTLCPAPALPSKAAARAHIRGHSQFFDRKERWRIKCRRLCRICGEVVQGEMEEHLGAHHPRDTFGDINDIVEEMDVAKETEESKIIDYPDQDGSQSTIQSPLRLPQESSGLKPPSSLSSPPAAGLRLRPVVELLGAQALLPTPPAPSISFKICRPTKPRPVEVFGLPPPDPAATLPAPEEVKANKAEKKSFRKEKEGKYEQTNKLTVLSHKCVRRVQADSTPKSDLFEPASTKSAQDLPSPVPACPCPSPDPISLGMELVTTGWIEYVTLYTRLKVFLRVKGAITAMFLGHQVTPTGGGAVVRCVMRAAPSQLTSRQAWPRALCRG